jgi:hypothetical protein
MLSLTLIASGPPVRLTVAFSPPNAGTDSDMAAAVDAETPINSRLFIVRTPLRIPAMTGRRSDGWRVRIPDDAGPGVTR